MALTETKIKKAKPREKAHRMVRTIEARGARDIAKRVMETTSQIFRHAIAHGKVRRNPAGEFRPSDVLKATRKTNYARIDEEELSHFLKEIEVYRGTPLTRLALKRMGHPSFGYCARTIAAAQSGRTADLLSAINLPS